MKYRKFKKVIHICEIMLTKLATNDDTKVSDLRRCAKDYLTLNNIKLPDRMVKDLVTKAQNNVAEKLLGIN